MKMNHHKYDVIIIGAGPAGLSAGIHLVQLDLEVLVLEKSPEVGGLARRIESLKNYPGFPEISGLEFIEKIVEQARRHGLMIKTDEEVLEISVVETHKIVKTTQAEYRAEAVIIATGSGMQGLGIKGESWFGGGIFYCDECCKEFLYGKRIGVIGSSPEVVREAVNLKSFSSEIVVLDHSEPISFIEKDEERMVQNNIRTFKESFVKSLDGYYGKKAIILNNGEKIWVDCVFIVGPLKNIVKTIRRSGIKTHRRGCIMVDQYGRTNVEGIFAAGACTSVLKDIVPACIGDGAKTAAATRMFLLKRRIK